MDLTIAEKQLGETNFLRLSRANGTIRVISFKKGYHTILLSALEVQKLRSFLINNLEAYRCPECFADLKEDKNGYWYCDNCGRKLLIEEPFADVTSTFL